VICSFQEYRWLCGNFPYQSKAMSRKGLRFVMHVMDPIQQNLHCIDHQEFLVILELVESLSGIVHKQFWVVKGSKPLVIETPHCYSVHWWKLETKPCYQMGKYGVENSLLVTSKTKWERGTSHDNPSYPHRDIYAMLFDLTIE